MSSQEESKKEFRLSILPKTQQDLKQLKKSLDSQGELRMRLYVRITDQNIRDYESGKCDNLTTVIIKEE